MTSAWLYAKMIAAFVCLVIGMLIFIPPIVLCLAIAWSFERDHEPEDFNSSHGWF